MNKKNITRHEEISSCFTDILPSRNAYYHSKVHFERLLLKIFIFYLSYDQVALYNGYHFNKNVPWSWDDS